MESGTGWSYCGCGLYNRNMLPLGLMINLVQVFIQYAYWLIVIANVEIVEEHKNLPLEKAKALRGNTLGSKIRTARKTNKWMKVYCMLCKNSSSNKRNVANIMVYLQIHDKTESLKREGNGNYEFQSATKLNICLKLASTCKTLINLICYWIAKEILCINISNDSGFQYTSQATSKYYAK